MFWTSSLILAYSYLGYPLLLGLVAWVRKCPINRGENQPRVSLIISVHNEEKVIREKLQNALAQDYPKDKLEIIVASDDSTDNTHSIVGQFIDSGIKLFVQEDRLGKTAALNMAVAKTRGDIIVFTDANSMYNTEAIRMMVENFADPAVGCVTGETRLLNPEKSAIGENEKSYYSYDTFLKKEESAIGSTVGADGAIFAVRKELYQPLDSSLINDFVIPLQIVAKGYRVVYEPRAFLHEATATPLKGGFARRVRIINRALFGLFSVPQVLNPFKVGFFAVQVVSRKLLRWTAPLFLIAIFITNLCLLSSLFYKLTLGLQLGFYLLAIVYMLASGMAKHRFLNFPYYFCHANAAALVALIKFFRRQRIVVWEPLRR